MCLNYDLCVFLVSSLVYPNSLGTKSYVVVVVVVVVSKVHARALMAVFR